MKTNGKSANTLGKFPSSNSETEFTSQHCQSNQLTRQSNLFIYSNIGLIAVWSNTSHQSILHSILHQSNTLHQSILHQSLLHQSSIVVPKAVHQQLLACNPHRCCLPEFQSTRFKCSTALLAEFEFQLKLSFSIWRDYAGWFNSSKWSRHCSSTVKFDSEVPQWSVEQAPKLLRGM